MREPLYAMGSPGHVSDVAGEVFLRELIAGRAALPHAWSDDFRTEVEVEKAVALHRDVTTLFTHNTAQRSGGTALNVVARSGDILLLVENTGSGLRVTAAAPTAEAAREHRAWLTGLLPAREEEEREDGTVCLRYLFADRHGSPRARERWLEAPRWADVRGNYSAGAAQKLDALTSLDLNEAPGKFAVLTGPPGTGKTTFLRALMREWREQAHFTYVVDPEKLFGDGQYMVSALFDVLPSEEGWNVVVCEDAEEFIAPDAKADVGQALSRLLNLGDGLLGQGLRIVYLFTTNRKMSALHPAMTRNGRSFAQIDVPLLAPGEANRWLESHGTPGDPMGERISLADLYALRAQEAQAV